MDLMKKFYLLLLAAGVFCLAGCVSPAVNLPRSGSAEKAETPIKTGFFVDKGSYDGGVLRVAQLLYHSPQLEVTLLNGEDIRNGKLDNLELLVIPGGSSAKQFKMITAEGAAKVREFVKKGGNYVGVCAGFHCTLDRPDRLALLPYTYIRNTAGAQAPLKVKISGKGAAILNVKPGKYTVYYSGGPISKAGKAWEHGKAEVLGEYLSVVGREGRLYNFVNHPAILFGNYGKGKVAATSFHPEVYSGTHCIFNGMIYAVSGRKITQNFPAKNYRPVRVGMFTGHVENKARILRFIELDRHPDIDVKNVSASSIYQDSLVRFDVLVTMNSDTKNFRAFVRKHDGVLRAFLARGGKIVAGGSGVKALPVHKNVIGIPAGVSFVDAVLKR